MMGCPLLSARIRLAQSLMEMAFVMQRMRGRRLRRASSSASQGLTHALTLSPPSVGEIVVGGHGHEQSQHQ